MSFLLVLLIALCFWQSSYGYHSGFLSAENTLPIKGIFTILVLFSHLRGYLTLSDSWINIFYFAVQDRLGQLIVTMFFFYSGFGIWESFKNKANYARHFFQKRFFKTLLHFDIIVSLFIIVQLLIPIVYTSREYLFCWIGWESVGNSNWFVFDILVLYLITAIALSFHERSGHGGICITLLLTFLFWLFLRKTGKETYWIDTLAAFPLGMLFSYHKGQLLSLLSKRRSIPYCLTGLCIILFLLSYRIGRGDIYGITACLFCGLVVSTSSWLQVSNPVLNWAGRNVFTIYMLQRLPMLVLSHCGISSKPGLFIILSCFLTFILAESFSRLFKIVDIRLFRA